MTIGTLIALVSVLSIVLIVGTVVGSTKLGLNTEGFLAAMDKSLRTGQREFGERVREAMAPTVARQLARYRCYVALSALVVPVVAVFAVLVGRAAFMDLPWWLPPLLAGAVVSAFVNVCRYRRGYHSTAPTRGRLVKQPAVGRRESGGRVGSSRPVGAVGRRRIRGD